MCGACAVAPDRPKWAFASQDLSIKREPMLKFWVSQPAIGSALADPGKFRQFPH
jgi:hypothetical protein